MELIKINEGSLHIVFGITEEKHLKLLHFSKAEYDPSRFKCTKEMMEEMFQPVQINYSGYDRPIEYHGSKWIATTPGCLLTYAGMKDERNETGRLLTFFQEDSLTGAFVTSIWQFYEGCDMVRMTNTVENRSKEIQTLEYISGFTYAGIDKEGSLSTDEKMEVRIPFNSWQKELNWQKFSFPDLGFGYTQPTVFQRSSQILEVTNTGNWSTKKYLPIGYIANTEADTALFWQIEHNGSWHWEISDQNEHFYVSAGGPDEVHSHWFKNLAPGECFTTVPVAVGVSDNNISHAFSRLTAYRRKIRRPNEDNEKLPVIFNDYMNCLFGDPTTEKELPLIDAAAEAGCEYFCVDAGWYSSGFWWDSVGEWKESRERFPKGIKEVMDYIRKKGMIPGVWLEPEVMGINCELAAKVPDDWFFVRHGKRVYDRSRYQLDYRNPEVIRHITSVVDRLVNEYGVGYIKIDYNIDPVIGTELYADSMGEGMLQHEKAYLKWLESMLEKYPDLVLENCSSGGLRIDYAMLQRYSIQSVSDQEDYLNFAAIAANAVSGLTPEQAAVWSYPQMEGREEKPGSLRAEADPEEETIFNMVNAILLRIHQSGQLAELSKGRFALVKEGIEYYKSIRSDIKSGLPWWGTGFADSRDSLLSAGLICGTKMYLAVWRRGGEEKEIRVHLPKTEDLSPADASVLLDSGSRQPVYTARCVYPANRPVPVKIDEDGILHAGLKKKVMARLIEVSFS